MSGDVLYGGESLKPAEIRSNNNYVRQEDSLPEYLTVSEILNMHANLRMKGESKSRRKAAVERVIEELRLENVRHSYIGGPRKKGISGGELKRVSIAIELLDEPHTIFLDEPTSGLDAALAFDVLQLLTGIARKGNKCMVCTVHQPRSQSFAMFDQLVLLSAGQVVYHGPAAAAAQYFKEIGYPCIEGYNTADFILDLLSAPPPTSGQAPTSTAKAPCRSAITREETDALVPTYRASEAAEAINKSIAALADERVKNQASRLVNRRNFLQAHRGRWYEWFRETYILTYINFLNTVRNPMATIFNTIINMIMGVILGGIFFQLAGNGETITAARNICGSLFFMLTNAVFSQQSALLTFPQVRLMFNRSTQNNHKLSNNLVLLLGLLLLPVTPILLLHVPNCYYYLLPGQLVTTTNKTARGI
eukprot:GHVT01043644.1.p1 GENE.GHVT01043644.1~~GHVT01043644.1.p1  ORF type:complete len:484 (+),score=83.77 GHVT01043644.1:195-1454(+)